jgi:hypothetical protein
MTEREPGFYWVKCNHTWVPSVKLKDGFLIVGATFPCPFDDLEAIGPRIEKPEELK